MKKKIVLLFILCLVSIAIVVLVTRNDLADKRRPRKGNYEAAIEKTRLGDNTKRSASTSGGRMVIKQICIPELGRVDRCTSCHDVERNWDSGPTAMIQEPLGIHSLAITEYHSVERFGCTVCHGGRGYAITAAGAHGRAAPWQTPMLPKEFLQASCGRCHKGGKCRDAPDLSKGRRLFTEFGCIGCHSVAGHGQKFGPDLTEMGVKDVNHDYQLNDMDWQWLIKHFRNPRSQTPNSFMPRFGLTDEEALALTLVVLSFRGPDVPAEYIAPDHSDVAALSVVDRGRLVFDQSGCAGCHGRGGRGGIRNPNMRGRKIPALATLADTIVSNREEAQQVIALLDDGIAIEEKKDEPWLREYFNTEERILDGRKPQKENPQGNDPPLFMPSWRDSVKSNDLHFLVAYVLSLFPDDAWEDWDARKMEK